MNGPLTTALPELLPWIDAVTDQRSVSGGCISDARRVTVRDNTGSTRVLFVKSNDSSFADNFRAEASGLRLLSEPAVIGVPEPIAVGTADGQAWLVTEWIEQGSRGRDFFERFGADLARLHRATLGHRIGADRDNFLGAADQINRPCDDWAQFVAEHRIGFQISWATDQGLADAALRRDCERIVGSMGDLLAGRDDSTSLIHGDLWSGNYLSDADGNPVIIDPAAHYACREAEFGMLKLFGSCPDRFYQSYNDQFPLPDGWQRRVRVYVLYHLLNHLNLFGRGYHDQCRRLAADIVR